MLMRLRDARTIYCPRTWLHALTTGLSYLGQKLSDWPKMGPNPGLFQITFQYILARRAKVYWNMIRKVPGFSHLGPIWPIFYPNLTFLQSPRLWPIWILDYGTDKNEQKGFALKENMNISRIVVIVQTNGKFTVCFNDVIYWLCCLSLSMTSSILLAVCCLSGSTT